MKGSRYNTPETDRWVDRLATVLAWVFTTALVVVCIATMLGVVAGAAYLIRLALGG